MDFRLLQSKLLVKLSLPLGWVYLHRQVHDLVLSKVGSILALTILVILPILSLWDHATVPRLLVLWAAMPLNLNVTLAKDVYMMLWKIRAGEWVSERTRFEGSSKM